MAVAHRWSLAADYAKTVLELRLDTHAAAARYEYLTMVYDRTADELELLRTSWADGLIGAEVVTESERVIAAQNDAWLARWNPDEQGAGR